MITYEKKHDQIDARNRPVALGDDVVALESAFEPHPWTISGEEGNYSFDVCSARGPIGNSQMREVLSPSSIIRPGLIRLIEPSFYIHMPPIGINLFPKRYYFCVPLPAYMP